MALFQLLTGVSGLAFVAVAVAILLLVLARSTSKRSPLPLPPGPSGEPILGHLRIIPAYSPEYAYMRWSKEYGSDILSFNVLGQPVVVLNSVRTAVDLLDKRGANYCDRPRFVLFEVMGWGKTLTFLRWGPDFRMHRRILQKSFQKSSVVRYQPLQERETAILLKGILNSPAEWENALRRFATAVVLGIGFGINIDSDSDPFIQVAADASYALAHGGAPAGTPVDFFPFLKSMPRCFHDRSLKFATDWRWAICNLHDKPFDAVLASEQRAQSLIKDMLDQRQLQLERGEQPELSNDDIKGAAGAVYAAGQDTTWSSLVVFILNMILHPQVQAKAQRLIDDVVGRDKLPTFQDRPRLLYIDYIVQETLRWCPVSPIGIPHRSLEDDVYNGYFIPAGSFVYANARAMTHDESVYTDPDNFNPDRYMPVQEGGLGEPFPIGQFGYGRRVCVGKHLAEASLWIVIASMLSAMNIEKARDNDGNDIEPVVELTSGLTSHPKRYPCRIVPRDGKAATVLRGIKT
ncbi:cytochrome p450 [Hirsutella rhossiliensis]|uniref:Cytochrome p450 domain-containing protein n=1 Tax=Hirsutella rhossiliensis TaxID=111463 RepID=A0A9P8MZ65_9HYPO|nr:cytochrome p450 domain-containing protein [Hirsutella rhossiliensis]KAH0963985.1 cytochrome p450 domain-containing protein [Hirsutella rhossiliensis]